MIANLISITRILGKAAVTPIIYIWNLIETLWENRDTNWEEE